MKYLVVIVDSFLVASSFSSVKVVEIKKNIEDKKQVERSTEERKKRERERTLAHRPTAALQLACNVPPLLCHSCGKHPSIRSSWGWANNRRKNFSFDALQRPRPVC